MSLSYFNAFEGRVFIIPFCYLMDGGKYDKRSNSSHAVIFLKSTFDRAQIYGTSNAIIFYYYLD